MTQGREGGEWATGSIHTATDAAPSDPYASQRHVPAWRFLHHLNPLAKAAAPLPALIVLVLVRDVTTPAALLALALVVVLVGAALSARSLVAIFVGGAIIITVLSLSFGFWADPASADDPTVLWSAGVLTLTEGTLLVGVSTAVRLCGILMLAILFASATEGPTLVRALVAQLRVPYRLGYTALAAFRFVPRFSHELELIRQAHRVRGASAGRGPIARARRAAGYVIPLLAGAIRHAERVALAMDSRAFGAHPTRTERAESRWRWYDTVFVLAFWVATGSLAVTASLFSTV